jgi:hypothetical protein
MSSPQTYTQTLLIDCNRFSSLEYNASKLSNVNNSRFTNKVSDGITLDIGDQVSIANAHIAQRGAGGSVIEFRGTVLGKKNITYTKTTNSSYIGYNTSDTMGPHAQQSPTGYAYETSENIEEEVDIKDNEITMVAEYYKNANAENYITLPRMFGNYAAAQSVSMSITKYPDSVGGMGGVGGAAVAYAKDYWTVPDGYPVGLSLFMPSASHVFDEDFITDADGQGELAYFGHVLKLKNDNSRYTLFKQNEIVWSHDYVTSASNAAYLSGSESSGIPSFQPPKPDPALHKYIRVKQKVKLSVPVGYNSPSNIAATITDQLTQTEDPILIGYGPPTGLSIPDRKEGGTGQLVNATINKAIPSVNYRNFSDIANINFFSSARTGTPNFQVSGVGASSTNNVYSTNYLNSYAYVGFKRPDLVETGREAFTYNSNLLNVVQASLTASEAVIHTDILWTDDNLLKISKFFDTQKTLYPELLHGGLLENRTNYATYNTTSSSLSASFRDEARFLHFQTWTGVIPTGAVLGSDLYNLGPDAIAGVIDDPTSFPLFIYFNENSSATTASQTNGNTYDNLAYGFARKHTLSAVDYVAFTTERIGGIPDNYFNGSDISSAKIGYDYHFSAYGNAAILPSTGYFPLQYYGFQKFQGADYIRHSYIGADNPLFNFDTVENRFELSNLHTAEKVGNFYNAGDPILHGGSSDILAPPPADQGSVDCYKINKQLNYATWSPSMFPYSAISTNVSATATSTAGTGFIQPSVNIDIGTTFDSRSGVIISDAGVDEANFDQSLWGLLGYKYSQFNASGDDIKNSNTTRFTNVITNVSGITTNANIISTDPINYPANGFATQLFTSQANSDVLYFSVATTPLINTSNITSASANNIISPPTTIPAESTNIKAFALPRKLLRGYFTLHSDILDQTGFFHNSNPMSVMASVGKYSAASDFITYDGGGPVFTVTRKKTITSITSQINDPEGTVAQVGDNSGIVYRIDKIIKADLNFATNLMAGVYGKQQQ